MKLAVAANARSGRRTDTARILALLRDRGAEVLPVELDDLARRDVDLPAGAQRLVVAGGDGSIGVAALTAHRAGVPLAVVATGTANDFARALDLPRDLEQACALAADPAARTRHHEVGMFEGHPFVNSAAAGLSVAATLRATPHKSRLGPLAYAVGAVQAGLTAAPLHARVSCDGREWFTGDAWQVVVAVTGAFGGGSRIGQTRHDDGQLDVVVVPAGPRVALARRAYGMRRGQLARQKDVPHLRASAVHVELVTGAAFNVDGEVRESSSAHITLVPTGVEVVVP